jgi:multidrug resistance efflux pump
MPDKNLPLIPIPAKQRWRDFRIRFLPPLAFLALVGIICWMWGQYVEPNAIVGQVETVHANIVSTIGGTMQSLNVDLLEPVTNGQVLAVITGLDPDQLKAELAAAESDLRLLKSRMDIDKTRNLNSYSQLRITLLEEKLSLDVARLGLQQAQQEFERAQKLLDAGLISRGVPDGLSGGGLINARNDLGYETAVRNRDTLQSEIATREKTVAELEESVKTLEHTGTIQVTPEDAIVEQDIAAQRERIEQLQKPVILRSPIDGFVNDIKLRPGEKTTAGTTLLVVSGRTSNRIVAWVYPPVTKRPQIGDTVEVNRMGMGGIRFEGTIIRVGSQLEAVGAMLQSPLANPEHIDVGLPLLVKSDEALKLIPGEPVQLRVIRSAEVTTAN